MCAHAFGRKVHVRLSLGSDPLDLCPVQVAPQASMAPNALPQPATDNSAVLAQLRNLKMVISNSIKLFVGHVDTHTRAHVHSEPTILRSSKFGIL